MNDTSVTETDWERKYDDLKRAYDDLYCRACHDTHWGTGSALGLEFELERRRAEPTARVDLLVGDIADMKAHNARLSSVGFNQLMHEAMDELTHRAGDRLFPFRYQQGDELVFVAPAGALGRQVDTLLAALADRGIYLTCALACDVEPEDAVIERLMTVVDSEKATGARGTLTRVEVTR